MGCSTSKTAGVEVHQSALDSLTLPEVQAAMATKRRELLRCGQSHVRDTVRMTQIFKELHALKDVERGLLAKPEQKLTGTTVETGQQQPPHSDEPAAVPATASSAAALAVVPEHGPA